MNKQIYICDQRKQTDINREIFSGFQSAKSTEEITHWTDKEVKTDTLNALSLDKLNVTEM